MPVVGSKGFFVLPAEWLKLFAPIDFAIVNPIVRPPSTPG